MLTANVYYQTTNSTTYKTESGKDTSASLPLLLKSNIKTLAEELKFDKDSVMLESNNPNTKDLSITTISNEILFKPDESVALEPVDNYSANVNKVTDSDKKITINQSTSTIQSGNTRRYNIKGEETVDEIHSKWTKTLEQKAPKQVMSGTTEQSTTSNDNLSNLALELVTKIPTQTINGTKELQRTLDQNMTRFVYSINVSKEVVKANETLSGFTDNIENVISATVSATTLDLKFCIFKINGTFKTYDFENSQFVTLDKQQLSTDNFLKNGIEASKTSEIDITPLTVDDNIEVYYLTKRAEDKAKVNTHKVPKGQLVLANSDINLKHAEKIVSFGINTTLQNNGTIKLVVSKDEGNTWYTYNSGWTEIEATKTNVANSGITPSGLAGITESQWYNFWTDEDDFMRFGYYINADNNQDARVDNIELTANMKGTWDKAEHGNDYDYIYSKRNLQVTLNNAGDYKVNYGGGK